MIEFSRLSYRILIFLLLLGFAQSAAASTLTDRLASFPQWEHKPSLQAARGDLEYPEWMVGTWNVTSTLLEKFAPLAPDIVTPGFEDNQDYVEEAIAFRVRFQEKANSPQSKLLSRFLPKKSAVVADRAFNIKNITQAYLGDDSVYRVKVDPSNPNRQITFLTGERKLISTVTRRDSESPNYNEFLASEVIEQLFRSPERIYLNQVEIFSDYQLLPSGNLAAEQITAIYLSPQDPDYFHAGDRPVALYRYHLDLAKN